MAMLTIVVLTAPSLCLLARWWCYFADWCSPLCLLTDAISLTSMTRCLILTFPTRSTTYLECLFANHVPVRCLVRFGPLPFANSLRLMTGLDRLSTHTTAVCSLDVVT